MDKHQFQELLDKYLAGKCTEGEQQMLHEFYDYFQKNNRWNESKLGPIELNRDKIRSAIDRKIYTSERSSQKSAFRMWRMAAIITVLMVAGFATWYGYVQIKPIEANLIEIATKSGHKSTILLSDGTEIRLNSESSLRYPETFSGNTREVILEGEAFFDVARNEKKPFIIKSGSLTTTVLGTSFNVRAFPAEEIAITVATGKVKVENTRRNAEKTGSRKSHDKGSAIYLAPNQQATFDPTTGTLVKNTINPGQFPAWKDGVIQFENTTLQDAVEVLERWYGVSINFEKENLKHCRIVSSTYKNENLFHILRSFQYFLEVDFEMQGTNEILLKGEGCKLNKQPK